VTLTLDRVDARWHFLEILRADLWFAAARRDETQVSPALAARLREVVDDLAAGPLQLYQSAIDSRGYMGRMEWHEMGDRSLGGDLHPLHDAVLSWSSKWGLDADWARTAALSALQDWSDSPDALDKRLWRRISARMTTYQTYHYERSGWNGVGSFRRYKRDVVHQLVKQAERELAEEETRLVKNGSLLPEPGRRAEQSYIRTARVQVLGDALTTVAEEEGVAQKTVSDGIASLLAFLDLPARRRPPGRRRGSRDRTRPERS
jgi:hypothetical protein